MPSTPTTSRTLARVAAAIAPIALVLIASVTPAAAGTPPTISSFSPPAGPVGTSVTITGANLGGATSVRFNGASAGFSVNAPGTQITTAVPSGASTGPISVTTPGGTATTGSNFVVTSTSAPTISGFDPTFGAMGTGVTITGSHFTGATQVKFHNTSATFHVDSDSKISTTVPSGASDGRLSVTTPAGTGTSSSAFNVVVMTAPSISGFSPRSGAVGASVSVYGSGFFGTTTVRFNGTAVTAFTLVTNGKLTTTVPAGATSGRISVTNPRGTATSGGDFIVTGPTISSFSPTSGHPGTAVTIRGSHFTGVTSVRFNGTSAGFSFVNDSTVNAVVPGGATTGHISLTTPSGTATSSGTFTILAPHRRSVTLSLTHRRLYARGQVTVADGYAGCRSNVPVVIRHRRHGRWRWVATTSTASDGSFRAFIPDLRGSFRAWAKRIELVNGQICSGARSRIVHHR